MWYLVPAMKSILIAVLFAAVPLTGLAQAVAPPAPGIVSPAPSAPPQAPDPDAFYSLGPDSLPQAGVPKGEIRGPFTLPSNAYPGTLHTYWVYVPAQYEATVAAGL